MLIRKVGGAFPDTGYTDIYPHLDTEEELTSGPPWHNRVAERITITSGEVWYGNKEWAREEVERLYAAFNRAFEIAQEG